MVYICHYLFGHLYKIEKICTTCRLNDGVAFSHFFNNFFEMQDINAVILDQFNLVIRFYNIDYQFFTPFA